VDDCRKHEEDDAENAEDDVRDITMRYIRNGILLFQKGCEIIPIYNDASIMGSMRVWNIGVDVSHNWGSLDSVHIDWLM
jgi:hypothetical protein